MQQRQMNRLTQWKTELSMKSSKKPKKSLRTMLIVQLIVFSVVPLAFLLGFSLAKYKSALDDELQQRLFANRREIRIILQGFQDSLVERNRTHATDKRLGYFLSANQINKARDLARTWMQGHFAHQMSIYNEDGRQEISIYRDANGNIQRRRDREGKDVYLSKRFLEETKGKEDRSLADFSSKGTLDLIAFSKVRGRGNEVVGYIEEIFKLDAGYLEALKNRLGVEAFFYSANGQNIVTSHEDLAQYKEGFFLDKFKSDGSDLFEISIRNEPFGFNIYPLSWGENDFYLGIGASKGTVKEVLRDVYYAFFSVVSIVVILLVILSFFISKIILKPLNDLVESIQSMSFESDPVEIPVKSETELGLLTESFNLMTKRVHNAQKEAKANIAKLEKANKEITETQTKLVHAAKMAGLGQLVAGIAHELNNPISFIYSNMTHLRDYSEKVIKLVKQADKKVDLTKEKEAAEFDYIVKDLPKLIQSCEEGARRTRDIVLGLRSFSRLEEAKIKEVDIHEGLDSTLSLLEGELKSRVKIIKNYSDLPKVLCYPSQLNQVFMNILSNAAHAIEGDSGSITISTKLTTKNRVQISIKDTGKGMPQEVADKIFEPFFTTKDLSKGTGLGMSISYGIIQKHGGDIAVTSVPGRGTEFVITLPMRAT